MKLALVALLPALMLACQPTTSADDDDGGDGGATDGGSSDGGTSDGGVGDGGSGDGGVGDGGVGDGGTGTVYASNLQYRLHDDISSMVYASWDQEIPATMHVEFSFEDGSWLSSPARQYEEGRAEQLLVGIPFGYDFEWRVVADDGTIADGSPGSVGPVPSGLPLGEVLVSSPLAWYADGDYLLTSINQNTGGWTGGTYWRMIIDREARPIWAAKAPRSHWTLFIQVAQDGDHILWDEATYWSDYDDGAASTVHRTYLDEEIDEIATPGLHHAFVQLPDGTLVWGSQDHGGGEALVKKGLTEDDETIIWTAQEDWPGVNNCESNGLFYDLKTDSFLYSFYTNNSIVSVDHATGASQWWAGDVRNGYEFDPSNSEFEWQHGISYTDDRTLLVSTEARVSGSYTTMVREYEVDHKARTLHEVWNYDPDVYASTNGDAWRLSDGNTLHLIGSSGHITEVDPDGSIVWHVDYDGSHLIGRGEYISDLYSLVKPVE